MTARECAGSTAAKNATANGSSLSCKLLRSKKSKKRADSASKPLPDLRQDIIAELRSRVPHRDNPQVCSRHRGWERWAAECRLSSQLIHCTRPPPRPPLPCNSYVTENRSCGEGAGAIMTCSTYTSKVRVSPLWQVPCHKSHSMQLRMSADLLSAMSSKFCTIDDGRRGLQN
jgi:hypothetical protein